MHCSTRRMKLKSSTRVSLSPSNLVASAFTVNCLLRRWLGYHKSPPISRSSLSSHTLLHRRSTLFIRRRQSSQSYTTDLVFFLPRNYRLFPSHCLNLSSS
ncbi:hypothetical protein Patl1_15412 [Pistacia atlantica]|uniref:Uncharacterized protein n=1 Tax=Pistacia atlantica TaxID=434234 RepID=A0ACC1B7P8_9ROSI|nr:hypothetical protein Patl1_15412 [Pistacia atlantica]